MSDKRKKTGDKYTPLYIKAKKRATPKSIPSDSEEENDDKPIRTPVKTPPKVSLKGNDTRDYNLYQLGFHEDDKLYHEILISVITPLSKSIMIRKSLKYKSISRFIPMMIPKDEGRIAVSAIVNYIRESYKLKVTYKILSVDNLSRRVLSDLPENEYCILHYHSTAKYFDFNFFEKLMEDLVGYFLIITHENQLMIPGASSGMFANEPPKPYYGPSLSFPIRRDFYDLLINEELARRKHNIDVDTALYELLAGYSYIDLASIFDDASIINAAYSEKDTVILDIEDLKEAIKRTPKKKANVSIPDVTWDSLAGIDDIKDMLKINVLDRVKHGALYDKYLLPKKTGVIFYGPPGTGKTSIAKAIANEASLNFLMAKGNELISMWVGESEKHIVKLFNEAKSMAPCILFFDEIESLMRKRDSDSRSWEVSQVTTFLSQMDGLEDLEGVFIMGSTNRIDIIDEAFLRPGRFDYKVLVKLPNVDARYDIIKLYLRKLVNNGIRVKADMKGLAEKTSGFSGADIANMVNNAAMTALQRRLNEEGEDIILYKDLLSSLAKIKKESLSRGLTGARGSTIIPEIPDVTFEDVGGNKEAKDLIRKTFIYPITHKDLYKTFNIAQKAGIIMHGPPGTGKTLLAKAVANEANLHFIPIRPSDILAKHSGEAESNIKRIFELARSVTPAIIFIDEVDSLFPTRGGTESQHKTSMTNQFLQELDGVEELKDVYILGSTNRLDIIDPAVLRSGRFDNKIYINLPDLEDRIDILEIYLRKVEKSGVVATVDIASVAEIMEGFSGADIEHTVKLASTNAVADVVESNLEPPYFIKESHIIEAYKAVRGGKSSVGEP